MTKKILAVGSTRPLKLIELIKQKPQLEQGGKIDLRPEQVRLYMTRQGLFILAAEK